MLAVHLENGVVTTRALPLPRRPQGFALLRLLVGGICNTDLELQRGYYEFAGTPGHEIRSRSGEADTTSLTGRRVVGEINLACAHCECAGEASAAIAPTARCSHREAPRRLCRVFDAARAQSARATRRIPLERAVFTEPLAAACEILDQVSIPPGETVAVLGDGKLGLLVAMVLQRPRREKSTCSRRHPEKLRIAAATG